MTSIFISGSGSAGAGAAGAGAAGAGAAGASARAANNSLSKSEILALAISTISLVSSKSERRVSITRESDAICSDLVFNSCCKVCNDF